MTSPSPTPVTPSTITITTPVPPTKIASPDIILIKQEDTPVETMTDMIFQNIGGQEIVSVIRNDLVNGINVRYQPIKNIRDIYSAYNSSNLIKLPNSSESFFRNFTINLEEHVPTVVKTEVVDPESPDPNNPNYIDVYVYAENTALGPGYHSQAYIDAVTPYYTPTAQALNNVYTDLESGDIVIDLKRVLPGEQVEVQIISPETLLDDTIYVVGVSS